MEIIDATNRPGEKFSDEFFDKIKHQNHEGFSAIFQENKLCLIGFFNHILTQELSAFMKNKIEFSIYYNEKNLSLDLLFNIYGFGEFDLCFMCNFQDETILQKLDLLENGKLPVEMILKDLSNGKTHVIKTTYVSKRYTKSFLECCREQQFYVKDKSTYLKGILIFKNLDFKFEDKNIITSSACLKKRPR